MVKKEKKKTGSFYTDNKIAGYLSKKVIVDSNTRILEPSFGDCAFIDEILLLDNKKEYYGDTKNNIFGVEIRKEAIEQIKNRELLNPHNFICNDFLSVDPFPVDIVIGNPPFIGLKKVSEKENSSAKKILQKYSYNMPKNGSMWLPFLLHSISFLNLDGKIAFVLPFEITYVRYSKEFWNLLAKNFSKITIQRVFEDIFPDVDVETILFIAEGYGGSTSSVNYEIFDSMNDLFENKLKQKRDIEISKILSGERPFIYEVLNNEQLEIIEKIKESKKLITAGSEIQFNIGYVSADKEFFHPSQETINKFKLENEILCPAISDAKVLKKGLGLYLNKEKIRSKILIPNENEVSQELEKYIEYGEKLGVDKKYKCRIRKPWYITPKIQIPDLILTVFGDKPSIYINSGKYTASNSLLCGYIKNHLTPEQLVCSWYNSLTLLSIEMQIHSLGGGVLVIIPGEANKIEIIDSSLIKNVDDLFLAEIDSSLRENKIEQAYLNGDQLVQKLGIFTKEELIIIRSSIDELRMWRNAKLRKTTKSD